MAKVRDCGLEVSEFELKSRYYVHVQHNTIGKSMRQFIRTPPRPTMIK